MFYVYDTKEKKTVTRGMQYRCNADRACNAINNKRVGIEETEKPVADRRYIVREA